MPVSNPNMPDGVDPALVATGQTALSDEDFSQALGTLAAQMSLSMLAYSVRFDRLLELAFRLRGMQLNVKRLREIAGGGSATTAQEAIERFRTRVLKVFGSRAELDPNLPAELARTLSSMGLNLWHQSQDFAQNEYAADRTAMERELSGARRNEQHAAAQIAEMHKQLEQATYAEARAAATILRLERELAAVGAANDELRATNKEILASLSPAKRPS